MELANIDNTELCSINIINKNFFILQYDKNNITLDLNDVILPFGAEQYNDKLILNIELENNNNNNNILSKLEKLETNIQNTNINMNNINKNLLLNKGLSSIIKPSKLGHIIRTHLSKNTDIFILKKNGEKIILDHNNLTNSVCDVKLYIKGLWLTNNNYGLYINVKSIKINKFL